MDEILAAIGRLRFRFAETLAHIPHEYVVRAADNEADYNILLAAIKAHGVPGTFGGRRFRYLYPGDGWQYWQIPPGPVINRARVEEPD